MPQSIMLKKAEQFYYDLQDLLKLTSKKDVLFIIGDWNAKVGSQEKPEVPGKFGLEVQNEAGQRLTVLPRECTSHSNQTLPTTRDNSALGYHQMVNTEITLIILFETTDGEAVYSQQNKTGS